jgi:hypothetical protein
VNCGDAESSEYRSVTSHFSACRSKISAPTVNQDLSGKAAAQPAGGSQLFG